MSLNPLANVRFGTVWGEGETVWSDQETVWSDGETVWSEGEKN